MNPVAARWLLRACGVSTVGPGCRLIGRPRITCEGRIRIGAELTLRSRPIQSCLGAGPQGSLEIGNRVRIGHGVLIDANTTVAIADDALIGPFAVIIDADYHDVHTRRFSLDGRPIEIGPRARIGARAVVLKGARIGADAVIAAGSVVRGVIPAGAIAAGVPAAIVGSR